MIRACITRKYYGPADIYVKERGTTPIFLHKTIFLNGQCVYCVRLQMGNKKMNCHIPYLTSKPFKSNSDVFGLTSDLCSDVTSTLLLLTPFVAMQLPLLFLSISTSPIVPCSPIVPYCLHTLLLPTCILTCILTCNIRALLSLLFIP